MATSWPILLFALCWVYRTTIAVSANITVRAIDGETRLHNYLFDRYERHVRPGGINRTKVLVNITTSLIKIVDVLEKEETLISNMWLQLFWTDDRLSWDPVLFGNLTITRLPIDHLWRPDIVLYNNADDAYSLQLSTHAVVYTSGYIMWIPPTIFRSHCAMDMSLFPFDTQSCRLKLGSWTYGADDVHLSLMHGQAMVDFTNYVASSEWQLLNASAKINTLKYLCCPEAYQDYTIDLTLKRRPGAFIYMFISPSVIMALLTPFLFLIPPSSGERITLGALLMICLVLMLQTLDQYLPPQHLHTPIIGVYYACTMTFVAVALALSAIMINISNRGSRLSGVPNIFRKIFLGPLKKLVFVDGDHFRPFTNLDMPGKRGAQDGTVHPPDSQGSSRLETGIEELVQELRSSNHVRDRRQIIGNIVADWQELVLVLDRIHFVVFMSAIVVVTMAMLI